MVDASDAEEFREWRPAAAASVKDAGTDDAAVGKEASPLAEICAVRCLLRVSGRDAAFDEEVEGGEESGELSRVRIFFCAVGNSEEDPASDACAAAALVNAVEEFAFTVDESVCDVRGVLVVRVRDAGYDVAESEDVVLCCVDCDGVCRDFSDERCDSG